MILIKHRIETLSIYIRSRTSTCQVCDKDVILLDCGSSPHVLVRLPFCYFELLATTDNNLLPVVTRQREMRQLGGHFQRFAGEVVRASSEVDCGCVDRTDLTRSLSPRPVRDDGRQRSRDCAKRQRNSPGPFSLPLRCV